MIEIGTACVDAWSERVAQRGTYDRATRGLILPFEAGRNGPAGTVDYDRLSWNPRAPAFYLCHAPTISVPFWPENSDSPVGVQFVAAKCPEDVFLSPAPWLEKRLPKRRSI